MDEKAIMLTAEEGTMQGVEDTIDCQEQLEQGRQFVDALCLEYQGKEVLSGKDKQGVFEAILDNLTDQGALAGFGAYVFTLHVIQQKQIEVVSAQFVDRTRILEALLQKADENVREHQLRINELESALEKEKRKVNIKEEAGTPGPSGFGRGNGAPQPATNSPYFRILRNQSSAAAAAVTETGRRSVSGRKSMSMLVGANGEMRQMNESEKIREYFQNTENRLPEDRPHDRAELASNVETMIAANAGCGGNGGK